MRFRLVFYPTKNSEDKYDSSRPQHEFLGSREAVWFLWWHFHKELNYPFVEVFNLSGEKQHPEYGVSGLFDYNP